MLTDYFTSRELGFVGAGGYRISFPDPADFVPPAGVFLVAWTSDDDGYPVGCGGVRRIPAPDHVVRFEIKHLWLAEATRGTGGGRAMLGELERRAKDFGATELVLDTNATLTAAAGLYASTGFVSIEPYNDNPNATNWYRKGLA